MNTPVFILLVLTEILFLDKLTLLVMIAVIWCVFNLSWAYACQAMCIQRRIVGNVLYSTFANVLLYLCHVFTFINVFILFRTFLFDIDVYNKNSAGCPSLQYRFASRWTLFLTDSINGNIRPTLKKVKKWKVIAEKVRSWCYSTLFFCKIQNKIMWQ